MRILSKKRGGEGDGGANDWLNTYADMVTLLLTFFAVLLSMSNTDEQKFNAFIESFSNLPQEVIAEIISADGDSPGDVTVVNKMDELYRQLKEYVEESDLSETVDISKVDDIIYIRFNSSLFFEPNEYILRQESIPVLDFIGDGLKEQEDEIKTVSVVGHTATEIEGAHWELSGNRASVVTDFFDSVKDFDPKKLIVMGYGNQYPVADNDTEPGRMKNRRVEMIIVGNESEENFNIYDSLGDHFDDTLAPDSGDDSATEQEIIIEDSEVGLDTSPPEEESVDIGVSPYEE